jgi:hypothetical protein
MPKLVIEQLVYLLDEAFEGNEEVALLGNLATVHDEDWLWTPPGGTRSIREIVAHAANAKVVYENQAFGDATLFWQRGMAEAQKMTASLSGAVFWLREGHRRLRESIASLNDQDLTVQRKVHYGGTKPTRFIISVVIEHDLYHAGEINHLRALKQGTDRWP